MEQKQISDYQPITLSPEKGEIPLVGREEAMTVTLLYFSDSGSSPLNGEQEVP